MKIIVLLCALLLSGCGAMMYQGMSADQITAAAKDNKVIFQCADIPSFPGGTAKIRSVAIDPGVVKYGQFLTKGCDDITFTNDNKPTTVPVPVQVAPVQMQLQAVPQRYAPPPPPGVQ